MITMTWMTSKSATNSVRARRQRCVNSVYFKQQGKGVKIIDVDINAQLSGSVSGSKGDVSGNVGGSIGASTKLGGVGWGSGNTYGTDTQRCDREGYSSDFFAQNQFQRAEIVSVGALPVSNRDAWLKSTEDAPSVVRMVLAPISELFERSFLNHLNLDADLLKRSFTDIMENYCQIMLGEDCPPAKGCALYGLCGDGEVCIDDPKAANGFRCVSDRWSCSGCFSASASASF